MQTASIPPNPIQLPPPPPSAGLVADHVPQAIPVGFYEREPLAGAIRTARRAGTDPITFERLLTDAGWPHHVAAGAARQLVDADRHRVVWWCWYGGLGVSVAAAAGGLHELLHAADDGGFTVATGGAVASSFTFSLVALPVALWGRWHARRAARGAGRWSPTRKVLLDWLLWLTAVVAIVRALAYVSAILRGWFVPGEADPSAFGLLQVLVTGAASGGLFWFGWRERAEVREPAGDL